ncbi:MAG: hypothetical protein AAGC81_08200 [Pseudomonadota bacterium]
MSVLPFSSAKIFVVYTDGVITYGAVFRRRRGKAELVERAVSGAAEPADALGDLISQLGGKRSVPRTALFASDRAVLVRAELPVDPDRPRKYDQMRELSRWEAEPAFSDLPDWTMSDVLLASGSITEQQFRMVEAEIEHNHRPGIPQQRFQDVALRLDVIDRATRDLAVTTQERLAEQVSDAACAWAGAASEEVTSAPYPWLISAISETTRQAWVEAFKSHKIKIPGLFPGWGLAASGDEPHLILERHAGAIFAMQTSKGVVEAAQMNDLSAATADEARVLERIMDTRPPDKVTAIGFDPETESRIKWHAPEAEFIEDWPLAALRALARHGLEGDRTRLASPSIALREPAKPLLKNPDFYRVALVAAVALSILVYEGKGRLELADLKDRLVELDQEFTAKKAIAGQIKSNVDRINSLKDEAVTLQARIADIKEREQKALYLQSRRAQLPIGILNAVRSSAHPGLVMRSISESAKLSEIYIATAWSVSEVGAEQFVSDLNRNLAPLGLSVADESVFQEKGLRGIEGYGVRLRIARTPGFVLGEVSK